ncbi:neuropilin and tolloid-like protein 1 [Phlebotomus papatasi]|uniref:neuropilin and tolloid-like protein 1 n=1 Tax=Phlebotomus papatasi TaxID=29031 RepID=UPI002484228D|nr:neuropilin and tolloid-like protein 1 [Phlebotomus papatasi]XP_055713615.1 neuropilin and tolloid-like protein 1 [Phlebotomus papatasi]
MTIKIWFILVIFFKISINSVTCHSLAKDNVDEINMIGKTKRAVPPEYASTSSLAVCESFVIGDPEAKTLYSPGYPGNYPNKTDCVVVLEAPVGFLIRLDFRDYFNIEPSEDCKFDFLEIRDGGHGFSSLIGQFCGTDFPPMVTSKERQLWLHFHSDENIEYAGFVAIYEYIPRPTSSIYDDSNCRLEVGGFEGWVNRTDIPTEKMQISMEHNLPLDCMWVIRVWDGWKIQLAFHLFKLEKPNDCDSNFVDVFGEKTDIPSRIKNFCGSIADSVTSNKNILHIRFYAEPPAINSTFAILFTAFREKPSGETCEDDEYDCEDATCISDKLRCNGRVNCRFRWDEDECLTDTGGQSEHVVIIIVVFVLILGGMFAAFLVSCLRKLIRDHKIIREHIRQSKESKLDELGRHSTKLPEERQSIKKSRENLSTKLAVSTSSSRGKSVDAISNTGHILDSPDISNRYYREIVPIPPTGTATHCEMKRPEVLVGWRTSSLQDESHSSDGVGMCDIACQTRESLFQPIFRNKVTQSPIPSSEIRFSTFGYNSPPVMPNVAHELNNPSKQPMATSTANVIEMSDLGCPPPPPPIAHHYCQHHQMKLEEAKRSQRSDEIRKSAPDVIIMTSH